MPNDIRVIQDTKIVQELAKIPPPSGGNQFFIIMMNQVNGHSNERAPSAPPVNISPAESVELDLFAYMERLPDSRLRNLVANVLHLTSGKLGGVKEACEFLGISTTLFYKYQNREITLKGNKHHLLEE